MAENSNIEWTDHTFNGWIGCAKVHAGCANCYAEADFDLRKGRVQWGPNGTRSKTSATNWNQPLKWNREAESAGERHRVFCASLADVFEDWQGDVVSHTGQSLGIGPDGGLCFEGERPARIDDLRRNLFSLIDQTPNLDWLLLTKRPENIRHMWPSKDMGGGFQMNPKLAPRTSEVLAEHKPDLAAEIFKRENVWLGTSVSDQASANKQIPELLKCRDLAPVLFLSCEPLLGPIDLTQVVLKPSDQPDRGKPNVQIDCLYSWYETDPIDRAAIDWVICGGESGSQARPMHPNWARSLRDQCAAAGVPFFFKQWGEWISHDNWRAYGLRDKHPPWQFIKSDPSSAGECRMWRVGKKKAGNLLDGVQYLEFPQVGVAT